MNVDVERWNRVIEGKENLTWDLWAAPIESSRLLTKTGQEVMKAVIHVFQTFFGNEFLNKCKGKDNPLFSTLFPLGRDIPAVYSGLLHLFTHIQLLRTQANFSAVRKIMINDRSGFGWGHAFLQQEVGGLALRHGWSCEFEPQLPHGNKADLTIHADNNSVVFEFVQIGTDHSFRTTATFRSMLEGNLTELCMRHSVSIPGDCFRVADVEEVTRMVHELDRKASKLNHGESFLYNSDVVGLVVIKADSPELPLLSGPPTRSDEWARLEARIHDKARQTLGATGTWIRMDNVSGLWYFPDWARYGLHDKLRSIAPLCQTALHLYPHIDGIIISNGRGWATGKGEEIAWDDRNCALRREFPDATERETLIIVRDETVPDGMVDELVSWYANEASWLDWALSQLCMPCTREIFK